MYIWCRNVKRTNLWFRLCCWFNCWYYTNLFKKRIRGYGRGDKCACKSLSDKYTVKESLQFGPQVSGRHVRWRPALNRCLEIMNCKPTYHVQSWLEWSDTLGLILFWLLCYGHVIQSKLPASFLLLQCVNLEYNKTFPAFVGNLKEKSTQTCSCTWINCRQQWPVITCHSVTHVFNMPDVLVHQFVNSS